MSKSLVIFTLGPIQDFIASARRSRDLRCGSWLLSGLARTAARTVADQHGIDALIFPKPASREELESEIRLGIANKIVAVVPGSAQAVAALAQEVEAAVRAHLDDLAANIFDAIGDQKLDDRTTAMNQVVDLLEFYWVAQPLAGDDGDYPQVRRCLEALMAARKATRDFRQLPGRPGYAKSSLDGIRESVIPRRQYPVSGDNPQARRAWRDQARRLYYTYGAGPAEQLSGVDLLKRQGSAGDRFPSTSHFAALPFLKRLKSPTTLPQLAGFLEALGKHGVKPDRTLANLPYAPLGDYDASLLFASRLTEDIQDKQEAGEIADLLAAFLQEIAGDAQPQPYYALLRADGDRMGATIDALDDKRQHQAISEALNRFAGQVEGIVARHEGVAVYSGGDDVLAFLPLHTALDCAEALAAAFERELQPFANQGAAPTLSTGVAVAHHLEPLSDVLRLSSVAEHAAKQAKDKHGREKHGLAIIISKRSGADRLVAGPRLELAPRLRQLIELCRKQDAIPAGAAYQIQDMVVRLGDAPDAAEPLRFEAQRILGRKPGLSAGGSPAAAALPLLQRLLAQAEVTPAELVNEMIAAQFFASAQALAEGK